MRVTSCLLRAGTRRTRVCPQLSYNFLAEKRVPRIDSYRKCRMNVGQSSCRIIALAFCDRARRIFRATRADRIGRDLAPRTFWAPNQQERKYSSSSSNKCVSKLIE
ncbi:uncharacterized protein LOC120357858 [Solenopsis invicta]|uniref:uncharacterized protein LOC120357858 n=1 Tax=Solenopsis invicta TaxID=13686 RepID=UPI00193DDCFF|nr:uncharacterized protein LOC120357858 [Solenopsis invicta]